MRPHGSPWARPLRGIEMHAFEPMPSNAALLRRLVGATRIPATIHNLAVGNATWPPLIIDEASPAGFEGAAPRQGSLDCGRHCSRVTQTTVDSFVRSHGLAHLAHVLIDAEGWDGLVLAGMADTLRKKAVSVVEFEYSPKWAGVHPSGTAALKQTLLQLGRSGYSCFWQDNYGGVAEATPPCWRDSFERIHPQSWQNLVCACRFDIVALLRSEQAAAIVRQKAAAARWGPRGGKGAGTGPGGSSRGMGGKNSWMSVGKGGGKGVGMAKAFGSFKGKGGWRDEDSLLAQIRMIIREELSAIRHNFSHR